MKPVAIEKAEAALRAEPEKPARIADNSMDFSHAQSVGFRVSLEGQAGSVDAARRARCEKENIKDPAAKATGQREAVPRNGQPSDAPFLAYHSRCWSGSCLYIVAISSIFRFILLTGGLRE